MSLDRPLHSPDAPKSVQQLRADLTEVHTKLSRQREQLVKTQAHVSEPKKRPRDRTAELRAARREREQTSAALRQLAWQVDARVAHRTAELTQQVERLGERSQQQRALALDLVRAEQRERD